MPYKTDALQNPKALIESPFDLFMAHVDSKY